MWPLYLCLSELFFLRSINGYTKRFFMFRVVLITLIAAFFCSFLSFYTVVQIEDAIDHQWTRPIFLIAIPWGICSALPVLWFFVGQNNIPRAAQFWWLPIFLSILFSIVVIKFPEIITPFIPASGIFGI